MSPEQIPEEARMYMAALQPHLNHPFVRQNFQQVTSLALITPGHGRADFFALEFRVGNEAALIWSDGRGNWGAGRWVPLPHPEAGITGLPSPFWQEYFQDAPANPSLAQAIEALAATAKGRATDSTEVTSDSGLRAGVEAFVAFIRAHPSVEDETVFDHLIRQGASKLQATRLVQFVPIAFTQFMYRYRGVLFSPDYGVLGASGQLIARRPVESEPAFRAAWDHCERMVAEHVGDGYFVPVAARSGVYRSLEALIRRGVDLAGVMAGPTMVLE